MLTLLIAIAAGVGAVTRYVVDQVVSHRTRGEMPYGTFVVNITGSLVLGVIVGWQSHRGLPSHSALVLSVGFAGGYTTLSTWAWESLALTLEDSGRLVHAALNVLGSLALGMAAGATGLAIALM